MFSNQTEEWQRLAEHYRQMSEVELEELGGQLGDLTAIAQEVLRAELQNRGMAQPGTPVEANGAVAASVAGVEGREAEIHFENYQRWQGAEGDEATEEASEEVEFTWKTQLAECADSRQAWQLAEALRRAGIDSWIDAPRSRYADDLRNPKVMVAADQLEAALQVAARPIPQEIIDASQVKEEPEEFELPGCPECGAEDPVLEAADETGNHWSCEGCGHEWVEAAG